MRSGDLYKEYRTGDATFDDDDDLSRFSSAGQGPPSSPLTVSSIRSDDAAGAAAEAAAAAARRDSTESVHTASWAPAANFVSISGSGHNRMAAD